MSRWQRVQAFLKMPLPLFLVIPFLAVLILLLWGYVSSGIIISLPRSSLDFNPRSFGREFESFKTRAEDGVELDGWFVPAEKPARATLIILHGWGANRSDILPGTIFLAQKYNLAYFDFRNHGRSGGGQTSLTTLEIRDYKAVVNYLKKERPRQCETLGALGFSMGGSVAISGSSQIPEIRALVAESPFSSFNLTVLRFAKLFYGAPGWIMPVTLWFARARLGFDPEDASPIYHVAKLSPRPLLIIQGSSDVRMPVSEGQALFDAAKDPKELWIVEGADHGNAREESPQEYEKKVLDFFQEGMKP